jgi:oxalate decarboxylase/phosphoglucose isomerase-like protein (cupin superfamily)
MARPPNHGWALGSSDAVSCVHIDRVRVSESVFKPGEENPMAERGYRVTRVLKGSTSVVRTHSNGKTENIEWKEGGVYVSPADNASTKNIGKSEIVICTVVLKK